MKIYYYMALSPILSAEALTCCPGDGRTTISVDIQLQIDATSPACIPGVDLAVNNMRMLDTVS